MTVTSSHQQIITLQLGNFSNFISAYRFNYQRNEINSPVYKDEIDLSVFWTVKQKPGKGYMWTPRTLIFDLKENWSSAFRLKNEEQPECPDATWDGNIERHDFSATAQSTSKENTEEQNESFLSKNEKWGDVAKWYMDSTLDHGFVVSEADYNSDSCSLKLFQHGESIFSKLADDSEEGVRKYAEDCDYLTGFNVSTDCDGFSGTTAEILKLLNDLYDKKAIFCVSCVNMDADSSSNPAQEYAYRIVNSTFQYQSMAEYANLFSSLSMYDGIFGINPSRRPTPFLENPSLMHDSAHLASVFNSICSPMWKTNNGLSFTEFTGKMGAFGRKMVACKGMTPLAFGVSKTLFEYLQNFEPDQDLVAYTPEFAGTLEESFINYFSVRGIPPKLVFGERSSMSLSQHIQDAEACLKQFATDAYSSSLNMVYGVKAEVQDADLDLYKIRSSPGVHYNSATHLYEVDSLVSLQNNEAISKHIDKLLNSIQSGKRSINPLSFLKRHCPELAIDDYKECLNDLELLSAKYSQSF